MRQSKGSCSKGKGEAANSQGASELRAPEPTLPYTIGQSKSQKQGDVVGEMDYLLMGSAAKDSSPYHYADLEKEAD